MVCAASPLACDSGQLVPVQLSVPLGAAYSRGGLGVEILDPEGTSGIPLCSGAQSSAVVEAVNAAAGGFDGVTAGGDRRSLSEKPGHLIGITTVITHVRRHG